MPHKPAHAADRLIEAIERKRAPICIGIDPVPEKFPRETNELAERMPDPSFAALIFFCGGVLTAVSKHVPCVKMQAACFERYRGNGTRALFGLIQSVRHEKDDMEVILDGKRGDIGVTAEHYAAWAFDPIQGEETDEVCRGADWATVNSYLGADGIEPFLRTGHGAFALARTSNPGGDAIQTLGLQDGRTVAESVSEMIADIGREYVGKRGYSSLGAVVGATKPDDAARLRRIMPQQIFLVPGYGAQGGGVEDVLPCFKEDGTGAIVTASRSVIYAFKPNDPKWQESVAEAAAKFADDVGRAVGMR